MQSDAQVDMIEFKPYSDIDLDTSPIVVLGCGHFFTAESLDGLVGLTDVYEVDGWTGLMSGLKDLSGQLSLKIPNCPHCRTPIRQHVTQRYNRLINRAVLDEMSKRFIFSGQAQLQEYEVKLVELEQNLDSSRAVAVEYSPNTSTAQAVARYGKELTQRLQKRYNGPPSKLIASIANFKKRVSEQHEPAHRLHLATQSFMQKQLQSNHDASALLDTTPHVADHRRVMCGGEMMEAKVTAAILEDKFQVLAIINSKCPEAIPHVIFPGQAPDQQAQVFLKSCETFTTHCIETNLPKLAIEATLCYTRIARQYHINGSMTTQGRENATGYRDTTIKLLEQVKPLCSLPFKGANTLLVAVDEAIKMLRDKWYEEVTPEEIAAIKRAMVSGPGGIATHSGHWYECANGHAVSTV